MRIWGYILIVLNIGAAGAFVYFATQIWKARTEWQLALVRQQLAIEGLPIEAPPDPKKLEEGSVPFDLQVGKTRLDQIKKDVLQKAIPSGGTKLGTTELVTNQTDEVKRLEKLVIAGLAYDRKISLPKLKEDGTEEKDASGKVVEQVYEFLSPEKRQQLLAMLISLARQSGRMGAYALYRDLRTYELIPAMDDQPAAFQPVRNLGRYERARRELKYLGRTEAQIETIDLLEEIGAVQEAITLVLPPDVLKQRAYAARIAVAKWLRSQIPYATPDPYRSPYAPEPTAENPLPKNEERERLETKLRPLIDPAEDANDPHDFVLPEVVEKSLNDFNEELKRANMPEKKFSKTTPMRNFRRGLLLKYKTDEAAAMQLRTQIDAAVKDLRDQVGAENGLTTPTATALVPFMADLAGNPLDTQVALDAAKARLLELMDARSTLGSEKKAYAAIAEILFATKPFKEEKDQAKARREVQIDVAGLEILKTYFEQAIGESSMKAKLPEDLNAARAQVAGINPLRDPGQKRRDIAHLLYHLDGYLAIDFVRITEKLIDGSRVPAYDGDISVRVRWFKLMFPAIAPGDPMDEELGAKEQADAAKALDQVHKERAEWHRRVAAIVGLETYVKAIEAQASELGKITARLRPIVAEEQAYFEKQRQEYIFWLIELNGQVNKGLRLQKEEEALKNRWQSDYDARIAEQKALEADLSKAQGEARLALVNLEKKVDELFLVTKKLGEAQDALLGLELQLREIELNRRNKSSK